MLFLIIILSSVEGGNFLIFGGPVVNIICARIVSIRKCLMKTKNLLIYQSFQNLLSCLLTKTKYVNIFVYLFLNNTFYRYIFNFIDSSTQGCSQGWGGSRGFGTSISHLATCLPLFKGFLVVLDILIMSPFFRFVSCVL